MFSEVETQSPFFPLSGESPRRVPGERRKVRVKEEGEEHLKKGSNLDRGREGLPLSEESLSRVQRETGKISLKREEGNALL